MSHGNSKKNTNDHHLYEIKDRERGGIFKYGISGRPLNNDGTSPRANEQVNLFNRVVGWARFFANILITGIPGRRRAEQLENEHIEDHRQRYGDKPPGNK